MSNPCNLMDCSLPGSSVHEIFQARILEWVAISFSMDLPDPGNKPWSPSLQADSLPTKLTHKHIYTYHTDTSPTHTHEVILSVLSLYHWNFWRKFNFHSTTYINYHQTYSVYSPIEIYLIFYMITFMLHINKLSPNNRRKHL